MKLIKPQILKLSIRYQKINYKFELRIKDLSPLKLCLNKGDIITSIIVFSSELRMKPFPAFILPLLEKVSFFNGKMNAGKIT